MTHSLSHLFPIRIYWEDTDAGGVVYHANYLRFAERARTEMLRAQGIDQSVLLRDTGVAIAVREGRFDCFAPARLDDVLEVRTIVTGIGGASLRLSQQIWRVMPESGAELLLFGINVRLACITQNGKPARMPMALKLAFERLQLASKP